MKKKARVVQRKPDGIQAFRGIFKGLNLTESLLKDRQEEKRREEEREHEHDVRKNL